MCSYHSVQLWHIKQHRTALMITPDNHHSPDVVCRRGGKTECNETTFSEEDFYTKAQSNNYWNIKLYSNACHRIDSYNGIICNYITIMMHRLFLTYPLLRCIQYACPRASSVFFIFEMSSVGWALRPQVGRHHLSILMTSNDVVDRQ